MRLAFIPARGGSKRLPRKNVLPLGDRPLLAWTITAATDSGVFDRVVVSTDDDEIEAVGTKYGAGVDRRPTQLGDDRVTVAEVLCEYLERSGGSGAFDEVAVLLPTCPYRSADDVRAAADLADGESFVISVSPYEFPPDFACDIEDGRLEMRQPEVYAQSTQTQSRRTAYHPNGAIYLGPVARFLATRTFFTPPIRPYLLPPERALDVDLPHQYAVAVALLSAPLMSQP